ncbi:GNAT family N-acetyltransferase [Salinimicrobium soli]|uniref:GNAT family N-acetyltransferase n=1 Tax=Salinimicrobium soli TaxID=1254399 RepID=UPI003AAF768F
MLRPDRPPEEVIFEGDNDDSTFHLGVYHEDQLVGIASYMKRSHPYFREDCQYQLRGMAVLPEYRGMKLAKQLLLKGEQEIKSRCKDSLLWFNARESAVGFYSKFGYQTKGGSFMIPNVCMHIVMFQQL